MTKKPNEIRAACHELNKILILKKLTPRQKKTVFNKLVKLVTEAKPGNFDLIPFIQIAVASSLAPAEKKLFVDLMDNLDPTKVDKTKEGGEERTKTYISIRNQTLAAYYHTIIEYNPEFRIEYVLYELNEELPESALLDSLLTDDTLFIEEVDKAIAKVKKSSKKKYEFNSLEDFEELSKFLKSNIIGQDEAIEVVCNALKLKAVGFSDFISLFFLGKTGRGKTQLANKLGEKFSENFWRIDCGEFQHGHEISRLIGSPPGYIGHTAESLIKTKSDKSNKWIILFDEIEKAHPKLYNLLLALIDTGKVTDNIGNEIDFSESIFIFTSNCGMSELKDDSMNWKFVKSEDGDREFVLKSLEKEFSPEFRGRIDEFVFFNDLNMKDIEKIAEIQLKEYPVKSTPEIVKYVIEKGYSEQYGARNLNRSIKTHIGLPLANEMLNLKAPQDGTFKFNVEIVNDNVEIIDTVLWK